MRFTSLGSGSQGNATLIESGDSLVLIDCGFSAKELERRMAVRGCRAEDISAILLTHEHGDHACGVGVLSRKHQLPVWTTRGTELAVKDNRFHQTHYLSTSQSIKMGSMEILPFAVPHDAREPCQFRFNEGNQSLGLLTDTGSITPHIIDVLKGCDTLLLEFNYDPLMLSQGAYPPALQRRIDGTWGHLSNHQAMGFMQQRDSTGLKRLIAMHISEKNNSVEKVDECLNAAAMPSDCDVIIADQTGGFDWMILE